MCHPRLQREDEKHESDVGRKGDGDGQSELMAITRHQKTDFKTDKGRNGAVSMIFIHVEITKKAAEMIHRGEKVVASKK